MGYPIFGKFKTIVLPLPDEALTIAQYKEKYGIDLKEFLVLEEGDIGFNQDILDNSMILLRQSRITGDTAPLVPAMSARVVDHYSSGSTSANTYLYSFYDKGEEAYFGLGLSVNKNDEFIMDNVKVFTITL